MARHINALGLALIKRHSALYLQATLTSGGQVMIGYNHAGRGVRLGNQITEDEAGRLLDSDLAWIEEAVEDRMRIHLNDNEFSALVSLVFDIGIQRFSESPMLKLLNKEDRVRAAEAITWLEQPDIAGHKNVSARRLMEKALFLGVLDDPSLEMAL